MTTLLEKFNKEQEKKLPDLRPGDTIKVHQKIKEGDPSTGSGQVKERIQIFEGIVIKIRGENGNKSFTVRKISQGGIGVERIFPADSPWIKKISIKKKGKVRRAKLYYLRATKGKKAKIKKKEFAAAIADQEPSLDITEENTPVVTEKIK